MGDGSGDLQRVWHEFAGGLFDGKTILDVGCGRAALSRERLARGGRNVVTLQDIDRAIMLVADLICDVKDLPGKWDIVTAFDVVEHVPDAAKFLKEIGRHAKDGIFFTTPAKLLYSQPWHFTPEEILDLAGEAKPKGRRLFARWKSGDSDVVREVDERQFVTDPTIYAHGAYVGA